MKKPKALLAFVLLLSCRADHSPSSLTASREARYLLETPENLPPEFWQGLEAPDEQRSFRWQRQAGWSFWGAMLRVLPGPSHENFMVWQSWYGREDLQRIFRYLYEKLGAAGRRARQGFTEHEVEQALLWNDRLQFQEPDWNTQRFEQWLAKYDTDEKQRSIPGMQKILFNRETLRFLLLSYQQLENCQKQKQNQQICEALSWPAHAVFLKTSWRRSEDGFQVERFATDAAALTAQWQKPQWTPDGYYEPASTDSFAMRLPSGQKFHLTGLHASLRLQDHWFWTSLWLGAGIKQDLAVDQPGYWKAPWDVYRLCTVDGWNEPLHFEAIDASWPEALGAFAQLLQSTGSLNWCSNPYLEPGPQNHKTNCTGCHQHAGLNWTQQDFRQRLTHDLPGLIQKSPQPGPADFVWSLFAGAEPLIQPLMDTIEYFDVYDPYQ